MEDRRLVLEELVELIETLRQRAQQYRGLLSGNESATRVALIDPLLRALGWPVEDPSVVLVEQGTGGGRADYVLLDSGGRPVIVLEAKALGTKLVIGQSAAVSYAWGLSQQGKAPQLIGMTDGLRWELYEPHALKLPKHTVSLGDNGPAAELAVRLVAMLWRRLYAPVGRMPRVDGERAGELQEAWVPLSELTVRSGEKSPRKVRFPDGTTKEISTWKALLVEVAEWLVDQGRLTESLCPLEAGSKRYLVHTSPFHRGGSRFKAEVSLSNGLWIMTNLSSPDIVKWCRRLCEKTGIDSGTIMLLK